MTCPDDIVRRLMDDANSAATSAVLIPPKPRKRAGHDPKIEAAVMALLAEGVPLLTMRPCQRVNRVRTWLVRAGYGADLPCDATVNRWFARRRG